MGRVQEGVGVIESGWRWTGVVFHQEERHTGAGFGAVLTTTARGVRSSSSRLAQDRSGEFQGSHEPCSHAAEQAWACRAPIIGLHVSQGRGRAVLPLPCSHRPPLPRRRPHESRRPVDPLRRVKGEQNKSWCKWGVMLG